MKAFLGRVLRSLRYRLHPLRWLPGLLGFRVQSGPFRGMRYQVEALGSVYLPKLLGCYERELHPWCQRVVEQRFDCIHDVGCAEGYFVVGFARSIPGCRVYGYDIDSSSERLVRRLADQNGVSRQVAHPGLFSRSSLTADGCRPGEKTLIMMDVEGDESRLLPELVHELAGFWILVELHDANSGQMEQPLRQLFEETHSIEKVVAQPRDSLFGES